MKCLIFFFVSFNLYANWIPKSEVGKDMTGKPVFSKAKRCKQYYSTDDCVRIGKNYKWEYVEIVAEEVLENNSQVCLVDCKDELAALSCDEEDGYYPVEGTLTVFCRKIIPEHIGEDPIKKANYDAKELKKANRYAKIAAGKDRRRKCENALSYLSGQYADSSEAETDAIFGAFTEVDSALSRCKFKKSKRLISEITDPVFLELRNELLEILE